MVKYEINIAKAHTQRDWRGQPAFSHHARLILGDFVSKGTAQETLRSLHVTFPWPLFHLSLRGVEVHHDVTEAETNEPEGFRT
jgi:hypothetical protein